MHKRCYLVVWKKHWFDWGLEKYHLSSARRGDCMAKATRPATARRSKACWSATSTSKKSSKIKGFQGNHSEKGGSLFCILSTIRCWFDQFRRYFPPFSMSFLCRAKTTMSSYVMSFEELLFQGLSANEMTQPLSAIMCVAIFPVNFPYTRKELHFLQLFISLPSEAAVSPLYLRPQSRRRFAISTNRSRDSRLVTAAAT